MKDGLLYKRCSKLERENQELKDTIQDKTECIVAYDEIIKKRDKKIIRLERIADERMQVILKIEQYCIDEKEDLTSGGEVCEDVLKIIDELKKVRNNESK